MHLKFSSLFVVIASAGLSATASAYQVAYNSFGPGFSVPPVVYGVSGSAYGFSEYAWQFNSATTGFLSNIILGTSKEAGSNEFNMTLYSDSGGHFGSVLETWTGLGATGLVTISGGGVPLSAGANYWLQMSPTFSNTDVGWYQSPNTDAWGNWNDSDYFSSQIQTAAFQVQSVPEPGPLAALALGALPLLLRRRRA